MGKQYFTSAKGVPRLPDSTLKQAVGYFVFTVVASETTRKNSGDDRVYLAIVNTAGLGLRFRVNGSGFGDYCREEARAALQPVKPHLQNGGRGLFVNSQTRPLHASEDNQTTRKGTSP